jgi:hypothetical protein
MEPEPGSLLQCDGLAELAGGELPFFGPTQVRGFPEQPLRDGNLGRARLGLRG